MKYVIETKELKKIYSNFTLDETDLKIPCGFCTALIGTNGSGKTTLLDILAGVLPKSSGEIIYFENNNDTEKIKEKTGYCPSQSFYPLTWSAKDICKSCNIAFDNFDKKRFYQICEKLKIKTDTKTFSKPLSKLSDGNKMKLYLASVLARDTDILILDEPTANLDPLIRDIINDLFRQYLDNGNGDKSIIFSTHNISDAENITDYAVFIDDGKIIEKGFTEDLKEKYIIVHGDTLNSKYVQKSLLTCSQNKTSYSGLALAQKRSLFENTGALCETPTLSQLSIEILKTSSLKKEVNL